MFIECSNYNGFARAYNFVSWMNLNASLLWQMSTDSFLNRLISMKEWKPAIIATTRNVTERACDWSETVCIQKHLRVEGDGAASVMAAWRESLPVRCYLCDSNREFFQPREFTQTVKQILKQRTCLSVTSLDSHHEMKYLIKCKRVSYQKFN